MSNDSQVADHPERLGRLAPVFVRRKIAAAVDGAGQLVLVRPDSVVVDLGDTGEDFERAVRAVEKFDPKQAERLRGNERGRGGITGIDIPNPGPQELHGEQRWSVEPVQRALDQLRDADGIVEANHIMLGSQGVKGVPVGAQAHFAGGMMFTADIVRTPIGPVLKTTSDPAPAPAWLPQPLRLAGHRPPKVLILDTGLRTTDGAGSAIEHPYLTCAQLHSPWVTTTPAGSIDDEDEYDDDGSGTLDFEAGHGTFITGIIQQICPDAEVHVAGVLSSFGDGDVANVIAAFELAVATAGPFDLVIMSLGGYMTDDDGELFGAGLRRLLGDGLGVAAAGNQSTSRPYFPAALHDIVGVGGLGQGDKAWFTNFGGWVDACAPAIDVISTFFMPTTENAAAALTDGPFTGWARWSGTSFAAPKVAAAIAQEMYLSGADAKAAWRRLSDYHRYRVADLGIVVNI